MGLDINEGMLAVAAEIAADLLHSIEWRQGDATELPFSDESFDVVCCQQALQFFDDPGAPVREMRRVLEPGGRVVLSVWRPLDYQPRR
ncbi:class I SAM-dependent methyltransferase [Natronorubrum bangense]|uniref:Methyltransferase type 11 n=1 Tax=Natronorubrum bangense JCM 10635 TaxID=1227500 RepID=L9WNJ8_9EURY|nr:Methyltransferase type 11 [Natronorubrum bangense JCM 10635]